jgi:phytanoyl-CoA hydroxylase
MLVSDVEGLDLEAPLRHLSESGYARLGRVLSDRGLEALRARSDDLMLGRLAYPGLFFQLDATTGRYRDLPYGKGYQGPSPRYRKLEKLELDPLFFSWIACPLFGRIASALIPGDIALYRAVLWNNAALGGTALPWHQDGGRFWGLSQDPTLQIWTALDDASEEAGCVEVLPGSHRFGLATPQGGVLREEHLEAAQAEQRRVALPAKAGEVLLLHNHLWHRSGVNRTAQPRRAVSVCTMSAQTRCLRKKGVPREFLTVFRAEAAGSSTRAREAGEPEPLGRGPEAAGPGG